MATNRSKVAAKRADGANAPPLFLRKTFDLITKCDPAVAGWSDDGTMIIIKDVDSFQANYIPNYFKHNKFASFVRQLHFYSFHKVKTAPLNLVHAAESEAAKYWAFHHDNFHRDFPERLAGIKKASKSASADRQEVESLKRKVSDLEEKIEKMNHQHSDDVASMNRKYDSLHLLVSKILEGGGALSSTLTTLPSHDLTVTKKMKMMQESESNQQPVDVPSCLFASAPAPVLSSGASVCSSVPSSMPLPEIDSLGTFVPSDEVFLSTYVDEEKRNEVLP